MLIFSCPYFLFKITYLLPALLVSKLSWLLYYFTWNQVTEVAGQAKNILSWCLSNLLLLKFFLLQCLDPSNLKLKNVNCQELKSPTHCIAVSLSCLSKKAQLLLFLKIQKWNITVKMFLDLPPKTCQQFIYRLVAEHKLHKCRIK